MNWLSIRRTLGIGVAVAVALATTPLASAHDGVHTVGEGEHDEQPLAAERGPTDRNAADRGGQRNAEPLPPSEISITVEGEFRVITANGVPDHKTGAFPNRGNPNAIRAQSYNYRVPLNPTLAEQPTPLRHARFGIALNGVVFDPSTAEFWNNDRNSGWMYDALSGKINLGVDDSNAHVQPGGIYHYHGIPDGLLAKLAAGKKQMTLVGYAADGFPIYGPLGYADANDPKSALKVLKPGFRLKAGNRPGGREGPGGKYDGTFFQDWEWVEGVGDLDACNGRTGVTPEYPNGTYYYVLSETFPFIPREWRGEPDASFLRRGLGPGRNGSGGNGPGGNGPAGNGPGAEGPGPGERRGRPPRGEDADRDGPPPPPRRRGGEDGPPPPPPPDAR